MDEILRTSKGWGNYTSSNNSKQIHESRGEMGFLAGPFSYEAGYANAFMVLHASAFIQEAANNHLPVYI